MSAIPLQIASPAEGETTTVAHQASSHLPGARVTRSGGPTQTKAHPSAAPTLGRDSWQAKARALARKSSCHKEPNELHQVNLSYTRL